MAPFDLQWYIISNDRYNSNSVVPGDRTPFQSAMSPVVIRDGIQPLPCQIKKQDNGAYQVLFPDSPINPGGGRVVAFKNLLYCGNDAPISPAEKVVEWELLSTAREGTSPDPDSLLGVYMIAATGKPRMVWTLPEGKPETQVCVIDLFTANGRNIVDKSANLSKLDEDNDPNEDGSDDSGEDSSEVQWKPRPWLWRVMPLVSIPAPDGEE